MRHPELAAAKSNRDFVLQQVTDAVNTISGVAQATGQSEPNPYEGAGELASALNEFDVRIDCRVNNVFACLLSEKIFGCFSKQQKIIMEPMSYNEVRTRPSLQERLESIISGAALLADSSCTRDDRRERIIQECNAVRSALQDLLNEYMNNVSVLTLLLFLIISLKISIVSPFPLLQCSNPSVALSEKLVNSALSWLSFVWRYYEHLPYFICMMQ